MARPSRDNDAEPEIIEFGIPVLDDRVEESGLEFPAARGDIEDALGHLEIPYDAHDHSVQLADVLGQLDQEEFESKHDLLDATHPVFEAYRQRTSTGFLSTLRSMLPF